MSRIVKYLKSIHETNIKQECELDTSTDTRHVGDTVDTNIQTRSSNETFKKEMTTVMSSQHQSHNLVFEKTLDNFIKEESVIEQHHLPVFSDFAIEIQETDIKKECTQVSTTDTVDVCNTLALLSSGDMKDPLNIEKYSGNKLHGCVSCGKMFSYKSILIRHSRIHSGEKPYSCGNCGKAFSEKYHLKSHERIHSGENPYKCGQCDTKFTQKSHLTCHERIHTGEKPFSCGNCTKTFSRRRKLKYHEKIHIQKPYGCGICEKIFSKKNSLKSHKRIHSGEKPYSCVYCEKTFSVRSNLTSHERIHTGETPFCCGLCGKTFSQKVNLRSHESIHSESERNPTA